MGSGENICVINRGCQFITRHIFFSESKIFLSSGDCHINQSTLILKKSKFVERIGSHSQEPYKKGIFALYLDADAKCNLHVGSIWHFNKKNYLKRVEWFFDSTRLK